MVGQSCRHDYQLQGVRCVESLFQPVAAPYGLPRVDAAVAPSGHLFGVGGVLGFQPWRGLEDQLHLECGGVSGRCLGQFPYQPVRLFPQVLLLGPGGDACGGVQQPLSLPEVQLVILLDGECAHVPDIGEAIADLLYEPGPVLSGGVAQDVLYHASLVPLVVEVGAQLLQRGLDPVDLRLGLGGERPPQASVPPPGAQVELGVILQQPVQAALFVAHGQGRVVLVPLNALLKIVVERLAGCGGYVLRVGPEPVGPAHGLQQLVEPGRPFGQVGRHCGGPGFGCLQYLLPVRLEVYAGLLQGGGEPGHLGRRTAVNDE